MPRASWSSTLSPSRNSSSSGCSVRQARACRFAKSTPQNRWWLPIRLAARYRWNRDGLRRRLSRNRAARATRAHGTVDNPWYSGESLITTVLDEQRGKTMLTATMLYESRDARDGILKSGMESGVAASYDRLAELLAKP